VFIRQRWYVAALATEVTDRPLGRTILGEHVALYRNVHGRAVALRDTCPHRGYPLSLGKVDGDSLVCGYHGFTFDEEGICVAVPGQDRIPGKLRVRTYPVAERGAWIFLWTGSGEPDYTRLPDTEWLEPGPARAVIAGVAWIDAKFSLLVDNLLDLSHETFLHAGSIGTPEVASTPIEVEVDEANARVGVFRHMSTVRCPPFYSNTTGLEGDVDRWQDIEYSPPGFYRLNSRIAPAGRPPLADGTDDHAFHMKIFYGLTPASESSVWDFWALSRDFAVEDRTVDGYLAKMQANVVQEDVDALNVLQTRINEGNETTEVSIKIDRGGLAARRILEQMQREELEAAGRVVERGLGGSEHAATDGAC
jgi:phenylpropionate dioxygenase-like ring-hydroxylating dioxygenase large terminal subunit